LAKCAATPVFFLITGFFFSANKPFGTYMSRLLKRVILPTIVILAVIAQLTPWLADQASLGETMSRLNTEYFVLAGRILITFWPYDYLANYNPFISLWFTFALIMCYLFFPVLKMICADAPEARSVKKYLMWCGLFFFIFRNTLVAIFPENFTVQHLEWWIQEKPFYWLWLMLIGHELAIYLRKREISAKLRHVLVPSGFLAFVIFGSLLYWLTITFNVDETGDSNQRFFIREFAVYMLAQMGMFIFFAALKIRTPFISRTILFIADKTFYVYMIHEAVFKKLIKHTSFDITTVGGYLGFSLLAFALCLALATALKKTERLISN
jgi:surface polysaccharide O-acyltransferase-like enzyme